MNIEKATHMIETLYPILQQEVQTEVRIACLEALLAIEKTKQSMEVFADALEKQLESLNGS